MLYDSKLGFTDFDFLIAMIGVCKYTGFMAHLGIAVIRSIVAGLSEEFGKQKTTHFLRMLVRSTSSQAG